MIVPKRWKDDYRGDFLAEPHPELREKYFPMPVVQAGRPTRHVYLANAIKAVRSAKPSVIFIEQEPLSLAAVQWALAAKVLRIPFGVQMDENRDRHPNGPLHALRGWVLRNAAFVAARSPTAQALAESLGSKTAPIVPHHVPDWGEPMRTPSPRFRIGFAGRLVPEKGLDVLVAAVRQLEVDYDLVVIGNGPLRTWLESQDLNRGRLRLLTDVTHERMNEAYASMDVLVLPSITTPRWVEQFGRVLVEAMTCGVPVVGSTSGEIPWVITATSGGWLFSERDSNALARLLTTLSLNDEMLARCSDEGLARSKALFAVSAVATALEGALTAICSLDAGCRDGHDARPRVLLVAHGIHDRGGMERACAELIRRAHTEFRFLTVTTELEPALRALVDGHHQIRVPRRPIPLKFLCFFFRAGWYIQRSKGRSDLIHTVGAIVPNRADLAAVHYCHAGAREAVGGLAPPSAPLPRRLNTGLSHALALLSERWCFGRRRVKVLGAVSNGVRSELERHYPGIPVESVPNGIDTDTFSPDASARIAIRRRLGVSPDEVIALFAGGDWDRKGLAIALEALALARSPLRPLRLWIAGAGDERRFRTLAARCGVTEWVTFLGPRDDIQECYRGADLLVLPTHYETFSMVAHEAAATALPIVAPPVSGIVDIIGDNEGGILVTNDPESVAAALKILADDAPRRRELGSRAQSNIRLRTWEAAIQSTARVYAALISANDRNTRSPAGPLKVR